jgi:hypothetical protein
MVMLGAFVYGIVFGGLIGLLFGQRSELRTRRFYQGMIEEYRKMLR